MSDSADSADEVLEFQRGVALNNQRQAAERLDRELSKAVGYCLNCHEPLDAGRYCDSDCRDDHVRRTTARSR